MIVEVIKMFHLNNQATSKMRTLHSPLFTSLLVFHDVTKLHLHTASVLRELAFVSRILPYQLPREGVGDGLVGGRVGHPARGAGRHLK